MPAMEQISGSECTDGPQRAKVRKWARCCRFCPANATTLTWSLKTTASPAPSPESVSDNALMLRRYRKELVHRLHISCEAYDGVLGPGYKNVIKMTELVRGEIF